MVYILSRRAFSAVSHRGIELTGEVAGQHDDRADCGIL
jgi:hypothetical protein